MEINSILYNKLHDCLIDCKKLINELDTPLMECIDNCLRRLGEPIQLAIIGKISSSKSTLVNAILGGSNIVATGCSELTYNVNWLTYGDESSDIEIFFKDGRCEMKPRSEWVRLANRLEEECELDEAQKQYADSIKYIRVSHSCEILKYVNIIDTPGLYSYYRTDSQNTINFLREVKPDAVVMLFTKSVLEEDLETLKAFQSDDKQVLFSLTPLNAIGLLAKIDANWRSAEHDKPPYATAERVIGSLMREEPQLAQSFFSILPIASLLGMSSFSVEEDVSLLRKLVSVEDDSLRRILRSKMHFLKENEGVDISKEEKNYLYDKYGLYGIYELVVFLKKETLASAKDLTQHLRKISGFDVFIRLLISHFRDRAVLIKAQNSIQAIIDTCEYEINNTSDAQIIVKNQKIQEKVLVELMSIHEYKEWKYLMQIYEGKFKNIDNDMIEEFKTVCGEYGNAAVKKLNMDSSATIEEMQIKANSRSSYWSQQYSITRIRNPKKSELCKVMSESYSTLNKRIIEMAEKEKEAKKIINEVETFFYGE